MSAGVHPGHPWTLVPALAVGAVVLLLLHFGSTAAPNAQVGPVQMTSQYNGSNGVVSMHLSDLGPAVTVSSARGSDPYGMYAGLGGIEELGSVGTVLSYANFSSTGWTVSNQSSAGRLSIGYAADMIVDRHGGGNTSSPAGVTVLITAPGGSGASVSAATNVTLAISISEWPWLHPKDTLALLLPLWPSNTSSAHLADGGTDTMNCVASDSNASKEYFSWAPQVEATDASGDVLSLAPSTAVLGGGPNATLEVLVPGVSSGLVGLQYAVTIAVVTHLGGASLPESEVLAAGLGAGIVGIALCIQFRATWARSSSLQRAEEDPR
jgi:hypothetical protein